MRLRRDRAPALNDVARVAEHRRGVDGVDDDVAAGTPRPSSRSGSPARLSGANGPSLVGEERIQPIDPVFVSARAGVAAHACERVRSNAVNSQPAQAGRFEEITRAGDQHRAVRGLVAQLGDGLLARVARVRS